MLILMHYKDRTMNFLFLALSLICVPHTLFTATIVQGDDTASPYGFTAVINASVFDPMSGTFYVALDDTTNPPYALSRATRPLFESASTFTAIGSNPAFSGLTIDLLALAPQSESAPYLVAVVSGMTDVNVSTANGVTVVTSASLNDATGAAVTAQIDSIATSSNVIFAAVSPSGGTFMAPNGGIAVIDIITANSTLSTIQIKDATTGLNGNKAAPFSVSTPAVTGSTDPVTAQDAVVSLFYDAVLNRLYIGTQIATGTTAGDVANSIVVGYLTPAGVLTFIAPTPNTALSAGTNTIVSAVSGGTAVPVTAVEPRVIHVSTGPDYLIVNGGQGAAATVGNTIYALPLVNNPSSPLTHGTFANKNSALTNGVFTVPAAAVGDLALNSDPAAMVGAGALPTAATNKPFEIQVYGDTVYVSLDTLPASTTDTGLYSSQAMFDNTGKIVRWTPWRFHLVPVNAFPGVLLPGGETHDGRITFFGIDEQAGLIWFVEGTTGRVVGISTWNKGSLPNDMLNTLNQALATGSYAALDLDSHTNGFAGETNYRYALFGGNDTVVFMTTSMLNTTQEIPYTTFSTGAGTVFATSIPGTARTLEYSRQVTGNGAINYFFAGTEQGFFAFAPANGDGFNVNTLGLLNAAPFATSSWQQIATLPGEPIAIKTSGFGNLYVLMRQLSTNPNVPFITTLYSIPFQTTLAAMFAAGNIRTIAQAGIASFANVSYLSDIAVIATGATLTSAATKEQLVVSTNNGLFYSMASQAANGIESATNDATAVWTQLAGTSGTAFNTISDINTPVHNTVWPISIADASGRAIFDRGTLNQFSGYSPDGTTISFNSSFIPSNFNSKGGQPGFATFDLVGALFDDGARRFFIADRAQDPSFANKLESSPFDPSIEGMVSPFLINYPVVNQQNRFYWIQQIGATGYLCAGTDQGVIALS
jgi:hypothetical protein